MESKNTQTQTNTKEKFRQFKQQAIVARSEAVTYVDLQKGDKVVVEVLLDKGASVEEIEGQKGAFKKVKYVVIDLGTGRTKDLYLTNKQSSKADEELEKLINNDLKPILRLKKVDEKTLDIEGVEEQQ